MKLIAVSFNEGGDFELHKMLFENAKKDFTNEKIIKKGVYPQEINTLNYYPSTRNDINLLIKNGSVVSVKFYLLDKPNLECGYLEIFEDNKLIYTDILYPYYPQS